MFLRALGLVYVIAFSSLLVQVAGLIGDRGVLPASTFLAAVYEAYGARGYWLVPTLAWFGSRRQPSKAAVSLASSPAP